MIEREVASIIRFILDNAGEITPYYNSVPANFLVPAVFFPPPEASDGADTLYSYSATYLWPITFHASTSEEAYATALLVLHELKRKRSRVPYLHDDGKKDERGMKISSAEVKLVDECVAQLLLTFKARKGLMTNDSQKSGQTVLNLSVKAEDS